MSKNFHDYSVKKINGTQFNLADYKGKAVLVVNVASECGLTPQYEALEKLYEKYHDKGLEVLGFPANEFGAQEPGSNSEIQDFCASKFGVKFPMFEKIVVKGEGQHPLYNFLTNVKPDAQKVNGDSFEEKLKTYGITRETKKDVLWNFEKFLIGKNGEVIARFAPDVTPDDAIVTKAIEFALN
ncbi:MAG: glutathione peroxidase [Bdellovibrionaceae bacterium]|nr:glutathione peroxidase [Pseudobdellovibrionaceae bacterium]